MVESVSKAQIHSEWGELRQKLLLPLISTISYHLQKQNACEHQRVRRATRKVHRSRGQNQHHKISSLIRKMRIVRN